MGVIHITLPRPPPPPKKGYDVLRTLRTAECGRVFTGQSRPCERVRRGLTHGTGVLINGDTGTDVHTQGDASRPEDSPRLAKAEAWGSLPPHLYRNRPWGRLGSDLWPPGSISFWRLSHRVCGAWSPQPPRSSTDEETSCVPVSGRRSPCSHESTFRRCEVARSARFTQPESRDAGPFAAGVSPLA